MEKLILALGLKRNAAYRFLSREKRRSIPRWRTLRNKGTEEK